MGTKSTYTNYKDKIFNHVDDENYLDSLCREIYSDYSRGYMTENQYWYLIFMIESLQNERGDTLC